MDLAYGLNGVERLNSFAQRVRKFSDDLQNRPRLPKTKSFSQIKVVFVVGWQELKG